jgi:hypothetical protein
VDRLWLALLAAALVAPLVWRAPPDMAVRRAAALGLLLTFSLVELPPALLALPVDALRLPGVLAPLQTIPSAIAVVTSAPVVLGLWGTLLVAAGVAVVGEGRRARIGLVVAAIVGVILGGLARGFFGTSYHQGLLAILLALLIGLTPTPARHEVGLLRLLLTLAYVAAGVAKLRVPGFDFAAGETQLGLIAECLVQHCNHLEAPLARPVLGWAAGGDTGIVGVVAAIVLGWELVFPLVVVGPRLRIVLAVFALAFHVGVVLFFGIVFVDFLLADLALLRTGAVPGPSSSTFTRAAMVVAVAFVFVVIGRVKAWPISAFELFASPSRSPVWWDEIVVERDRVETTVWLPDVFPAHAVASPRRWLEGCAAEPDDEHGDARRRCEAWLTAIAARTGADAIRVDRHVATWKEIGRGSRGVIAGQLRLVRR